jgi:hypothetical protein
MKNNLRTVYNKVEETVHRILLEETGDDRCMSAIRLVMAELSATELRKFQWHRKRQIRVKSMLLKLIAERLRKEGLAKWIDE